jgi:hypothetical protein
VRGHDSASYQTLVGRVPPVGDNQNFGEHPDAFPCHGVSVSYAWRDRRILVPHASLPFVMNNNIINPGQTAGFLGAAYQPLRIFGEPDTQTYHAGALNLLEGITPERLEHRRSLLRSLDQHTSTTAKTMRVFHERAFDLLGSDGLRNALDIQQESPKTRERYGHGPAGQKYDDNPKSMASTELAIARNLRGWNLLLARRLVETGVPFVNVYDYKQQGKNWDSHAKNFEYLKQHLLPPADQAFAALVEDLDERGLLDTTLVVALGEFGRTPRINKDAGRDHWPDCYTALLAGGGIKAGYVHGASDRIGAYPDRDAVTPADLAATIFTLFGIDPTSKLRDSLDRPFQMCEGRPVRDVLA